MLKLKNGNYVGRHVSGKLVEIVRAEDLDFNQVKMEKALLFRVIGLEPGMKKTTVAAGLIDLEV